MSSIKPYACILAMFIMLVTSSHAARAETISLKCEVTEMVGSSGSRFPVQSLPEAARVLAQSINVAKKTVGDQAVQELTVTDEVISWKWASGGTVTIDRLTGVETQISAVGGRESLLCKAAKPLF